MPAWVVVNELALQDITMIKKTCSFGYIGICMHSMETETKSLNSNIAYVALVCVVGLGCSVVHLVSPDSSHT